MALKKLKMLNKDISWREFKMSEIFEFSKGKRLTKADMEEGTLNYIGAISDNNGIRQFINATATHKGNCITVNYNGSVGEAFYQKDCFWASDDVNILRVKHRELNRNLGLFLCTMIKANKYRFSYGRKWTLEKMKESILLLPSDSDGSPAWFYMEEYIENIVQETEIDTLSDTVNDSISLDPLDVTQWKEFKISDLFSYERGKRLVQEERIKGTFPLVTAGEGNLGVKDFISNKDQKKFSNQITIDMFCNSYTHVDTFCCDDNILTLTSKTPISKYAMLFINTIIEKDKYRYQYGRQYRQKNFLKHSIMLPSTSTGEVNWKFMEDYIKQLPYADKI